ncbi:MAG: GntR family transcriptional regulator [Paracoccaceae bacterium]
MQDTLEKLLEEDIVFGVYAPGTRMFEDRVMERYSVSRHATRVAFSALESRKLLVHIPNKGVEVIRYTPDEVDALYDIRMVLETAAAERTTLAVAPSIIETLTQIAQQHEEAWCQGDYRQVFALNLQFHHVQYSCCENVPLIGLIEDYMRMVQPIRAIKYDDPQHMREVIAQHHRIIRAMQGTDSQSYIDAVREHLPASARAYREFHANRIGRGASSFAQTRAR